MQPFPFEKRCGIFLAATSNVMLGSILGLWRILATATTVRELSELAIWPLSAPTMMPNIPINILTWIEARTLKLNGKTKQWLEEYYKDK